MTESIVERLDHLIIKTPDPQGLYDALTQLLYLSPAWPVSANPFFTSGGVRLGSIELELIHFQNAASFTRVHSLGQPALQPGFIIPTGSPGEPAQAQLYGVGLKLAPFEYSLEELDRRGVPRTPPQPFFLVDEQGWQVNARSQVFLGKLLGESSLSRLFFGLSRRAPDEMWEKSAFPNRRFSLPFLFTRVFRRGAVLAVEHNPAWRLHNVREIDERAGLDAAGIYEVAIGVRKIERARTAWQALLDPALEVRKGIWRLPGGTHIHLVESAHDGLRGLIVQVHSLNRAVQFLHRRRMLGEERGGMPTIRSESIQGLDICLVQ